jgi:hypothetical protein
MDIREYQKLQSELFSKMKLVDITVSPEVKETVEYKCAHAYNEAIRVCLKTIKEYCNQQEEREMKAVSTGVYELNGQTYFEAVIELDNGYRVYSNIEVEKGKKAEVLEDGYWLYKKSHAEVDFENPEQDYAELDEKTTRAVVRFTVQLWDFRI